MKSETQSSQPKLEVSNPLRDVLERATQRLTQAGCDTPRLDAEVLLAHALSQNRTWLYLHPVEALDESQQDRFNHLLSRRERREPVAYITGLKAFFGLEFQVTPQVLIPRPETELLVETAIEMAQSQSARPNSQAPVSIAEVGTGSGCIAIALAKNLAGASIFALDTSEAALQLARQNAIRHAVEAKLIFLRGDLLQPLTNPVDLIVSNPPYLSRSDLLAASPEVSRYEPRLALDGGEDGLDVIRRLLPQTREKLKPGGSLLIEMGAGQGHAVIELAQIHFPDATTIRVKQDLAGLDRLLVVRLSVI